MAARVHGVDLVRVQISAARLLTMDIVDIEQKHTPRRILRDVGAIITSIVVAYLLVQSGAFNQLLAAAMHWKLLGTLVAGVFFTSIFTVAISTITIAEIATTTNPLVVAIIGGVGAALGDFLIFKFFENHLAEDVKELLKISKKRIKFVFRFRFFRFLIPFFGALIIASPLPDEIGLAMMGVIHLKPKFLIPISYLLNSLGILIIGLIARGLVN